MNLPQSTLHLPKTLLARRRGNYRSVVSMKLLPEQEKDNFAKLNPAQKAVSTVRRRGWDEPPHAARRHANQRMPIYCNQCPLHEVLVRRKRRIELRTSCACDTRCVFDRRRPWVDSLSYTERTYIGGGTVSVRN